MAGVALLMRGRVGLDHGSPLKARLLTTLTP